MSELDITRPARATVHIELLSDGSYLWREFGDIRWRGDTLVVEHLQGSGLDSVRLEVAFDAR